MASSWARSLCVCPKNPLLLSLLFYFCEELVTYIQILPTLYLSDITSQVLTLTIIVITDLPSTMFHT